MTVKHSRPTSPHLQVYQLPLTGIISITHRITGILLSLGLLLVIALFYALSQGESAYGAMQAITSGWTIKIMYWGFIYALFFHLCHGIRHLFWDMGAGFEASQLTRYAIIELVAALLLTLATGIFI
jgi:succinate dehydrogenase / fumarate reductase, cytochrome b subunit